MSNLSDSGISYVELLAQSHFAFLTGASRPDELINEAYQKGLKGLALADRNSVSGLVRGFEGQKGYSTKGDFFYLVGVNVDLEEGSQVTLLAENRSGYGKITEWLTQWSQRDLLSISELKSNKSKQNEFQSNKGREYFYDFWNRETAQGVVCLPRNPLKDWLEPLAEIFRGSCYLPLVRYLDGHDRQRQSEALRYSARLGLPIVASNDVYYHQKERKAVQDVLLSIRENRPLRDMGFRLFSNAERYIKSPQEMLRLFVDHPVFLNRTLDVAERCHFQLSELRYCYPSEWIPQGHSAQSYLSQLVWEGVRKRYPKGVLDRVKEQIFHELRLIEKKNFADYFLTIYDIVAFAQRCEILCQGRGSAANSVVCYVLGITAIDPVTMNLLFERFISEERSDPPDIDVDFEHERREEVIQYIYEKYGRNRAAMVCNYVCFRRRSALREVAKAFGVPVGTRSARQLEREWSLLVPDSGLRDHIQNIADQIQGFPQHLSIHSGGFTLSADPLTRLVPVVPARMEGRTVIQWDKNDLEALGLLKVDILSLGILSALKKTLKAVGLNLYEIPQGDSATYAMLQKADTIGTFQVESRAQMSMLGRLQPKCFYDMVIQVAIVRPGPIVGKMVHPYLKRRRGWEKEEYPHPQIKQILGKTLGVPLFQEQVMKLAMDLADFTPGEADQLRRAIGAWKSQGPMAPVAARLKQGLADKNLPQPWIEKIFSYIQGFSEYGFPESHAASFALLAYASCYLRCHYLQHYLCAVINSQPMGFYRVDTLIYDGLRHGVRVLPIHLNYSQWDCVIDESGALRLGFRLVRGLNRKEYERLARERLRRPFRSARDFLFRTQWRESLWRRFVLAGRVGDPQSVLWSLLAYSIEDTAQQEQRSLFEWEGEEGTEVIEGGLCVNSNLMAPPWDPMDPWDRNVFEYESFGYSTQGHPLEILRKTLRLSPWTARTIKKAPSGSVIDICGMVLLLQRPHTARGMVFVSLEDETGLMDLVLTAELYEEHRDTFITSCFLRVKGQIQKDREAVSIKVLKLSGIETPKNESMPGHGC